MHHRETTLLLTNKTLFIAHSTLATTCPYTPSQLLCTLNSSTNFTAGSLKGCESYLRWKCTIGKFWWVGRGQRSKNPPPSRCGRATRTREGRLGENVQPQITTFKTHSTGIYLNWPSTSHAKSIIHKQAFKKKIIVRACHLSSGREEDCHISRKF